MNKELIIIGASGHAKVVASTALSMGFKQLYFYDDNPTIQGEDFFTAYSIVGTTDDLLTSKSNIPIVIAIGDNYVRAELSHKLSHCNWATLIHPRAIVDTSVSIGQGTVVFAGAVIQPDTKIGKHCIINTAATIDHDNVLDDYSHIAPGAHLTGNIQLGQNSFIGAGAAVIPNITMGKNVVIGAGSVVIRNVPDNTKLAGNPATVI